MGMGSKTFSSLWETWRFPQPGKWPRTLLRMEISIALLTSLGELPSQVIIQWTPNYIMAIFYAKCALCSPHKPITFLRRYGYGLSFVSSYLIPVMKIINSTCTLYSTPLKTQSKLTMCNHWPLGDMVVITKVLCPKICYGFCSWALVKLLSG